MSIDIVISRFYEPWDRVFELYHMVRTYPSNAGARVRVFVYNKGIKDVPEIPVDIRDREAITITELPNLGREGHTYIHHIIKHYNDLSSKIIFTPASWYVPAKISLMISLAKRVSHELFWPPNQLSEDMDFTLQYWLGNTPENSVHVHKMDYTLASVRPFGKWFQHYFEGVPYIGYSWLAMFSVDSKRVQQYPIENYERWMYTLSERHGPNGEEVHYWERVWGTIFGQDVNFQMKE